MQSRASNSFGPLMHALSHRDQQVCWHPYTQHQTDRILLPVVSAQQATLNLADGSQCLDAISSWWAVLHGHARPELVEALSTQAQTLDHVLFAGFTHEPAVQLAETLLQLAPSGLNKVFYSDNGSTAVEVGLKAAYQYWLRRGEKQRQLFLCFDGGYHGDTFGAMAVGDPDPFFLDFQSLMFPTLRLPMRVDAVASVMERHENQIAGVLIEPLVQGAAGMCMHPPEFLQQLRALCNQHRILFLADEVMTGFGRTGHTFACQAAQIQPDILCVAKGLTGGILPLAATLVREEIYQAFLSEERNQAFFHGHTFTANPIGCAVALASMKLLQKEQTAKRLERIGQQLFSSLRKLEDCPQVKEVRQCGGIVAVEMKAADAGYLAQSGAALRQACRQQKEVLLRPLGNVLYAMPPSCTTKEEANRIAAAMHQVVQDSLLLQQD